jgi:hypothetical protein
MTMNLHDPSISASRLSGNMVVPETIPWDFNYAGDVKADPSAADTMTPSYTFTSPDTYLVALQLEDSNNVTGIGLMYVDVSDVGPTVDPGADQTVNVGDTVSFNATATDPAGASGITSEQRAKKPFSDGDITIRGPSNKPPP